jgi:hypothetical protein
MASTIKCPKCGFQPAFVGGQCQDCGVKICTGCKATCGVTCPFCNKPRLKSAS